MSTASAEKTNPMNWTCSLLRRVFARCERRSIPCGDDSQRSVLYWRVRALYAIAQGTMMNRRFTQEHTPLRSRTSHDELSPTERGNNAGVAMDRVS